MSHFVEIPIECVVRRTVKAMCVRTDEREVWFPYRALRITAEVEADRGYLCVPPSLCEEKGLSHLIKPRPPPTFEVISIDVEGDDLKLLKRIAESEDRTMSSIASEVMRDWIDAERCKEQGR